MPLTHPFSKVLCPFCFEYFHLGQAPVRIASSSELVNDDVVQNFLHLPAGAQALMPPVEEPTGFFNKALRYFYYPSLRSGQVVRYRICPKCHMKLPIQLANNKMTSNIIAVTGYRDSGKSNFFGVLINELKNRYSQEVGLNLITQETFSVNEMRSVFSDQLYTERYGADLLGDNPQVVRATLSAQTNIDIRIPLIYRLNLTRFTKKQRMLNPFAKLRPIDLVFFDAAGEDMSSPEALAQYCRYISRAAGIIALIDPLSYPEIRSEITMNYNSTSYQNRPYDTMGVLTQTIESSDSHAVTQKIKTPLAVTISKFDLLRNIDSLNPFVFEDHVHSSGFDAIAADNASNAIRDFLVSKRIYSITSVVENNFKTYKYFGMSALGRSPRPDRSLSSIEPINIADSLFWILNQLGCLQTEEEMKG